MVELAIVCFSLSLSSVPFLGVFWKQQLIYAVITGLLGYFCACPSIAYARSQYDDSSCLFNFFCVPPFFTRLSLSSSLKTHTFSLSTPPHSSCNNSFQATSFVRDMVFKVISVVTCASPACLLPAQPASCSMKSKSVARPLHQLLAQNNGRLASVNVVLVASGPVFMGLSTQLLPLPLLALSTTCQNGHSMLVQTQLFFAISFVKAMALRATAAWTL